MYRIRFHGRGGQGIKTASRILGTSFFLEGFEVQDAPRYGAERRGAPLFAYVRASREAINERGIIRKPDLVIVADDSLIPIPASGVMQGITDHTVMLINSIESPDTWQKRLNLPNQILTLPLMEGAQTVPEQKYVGSVCVGAAAHLIGIISRASLEEAIRDELSPLGTAVMQQNLDRALEAHSRMTSHAGCVKEGEGIPAKEYEHPDWVELSFDDARVSAPVIHGSATSVEVKTGLWRIMRPVIDYDLCNRCAWICGSFCPDSAINVNEKGYPQIDYEHCKGCMVCVVQCPPHAISAKPEHADNTES
jgi:pyruvate ferredoxin oxidoreductase gamma subunit